MLSIALQIHRNIFSAQCYIRYVADSNCVKTIQVQCFSSELQLLFLKNDETVKNVKIIAPNDLFIPSSLSSDSSVISNSTIICETTLTPAGQSVTECSFRLQISGADKLNQSESVLKVDVKDFFKERFKNGGHWNLFCASCGVGLPLEPVCIENVQEYSESELSEGWFCHGNAPQPSLQPSSRTLYLDDTSFYLYPRPDLHTSCDIKKVLDKNCSNHDTGCEKNGYINVLSTGCSDFTHSDSSEINCSSKSVNSCDLKNIEESISQGLNSLDFSATNFTHAQKPNHLTSLDLNYSSVKNQNDLHPQIPNNNSSSFKQTESSAKSSRHHSCDDYKHSAVDKNEYSNDFKVLNPVVECQSCGNVLTSEKSSFPFVRFYLDKLMFKNSSANDSHLEYAHKIILLSFWSLVAKSRTSFMPSKLFLQSKVRGEELCLLLWIPSAPLAQFLLQNSFEGIPLEINLKMEPVYKVLYFVGTSRSENVRSWRHDFSVDFYHASDTVVKRLAEILDSSSSYLPKTSDAGGFSCGFLNAPSQLLL